MTISWFSNGIYVFWNIVMENMVFWHIWWHKWKSKTLLFLVVFMWFSFVFEHLVFLSRCNFKLLMFLSLCYYLIIKSLLQMENLLVLVFFLLIIMSFFGQLLNNKVSTFCICSLFYDLWWMLHMIID